MIARALIGVSLVVGCSHPTAPVAPPSSGEPDRLIGVSEVAPDAGAWADAAPLTWPGGRPLDLPDAGSPSAPDSSDDVADGAARPPGQSRESLEAAFDLVAAKCNLKMDPPRGKVGIAIPTAYSLPSGSTGPNILIGFATCCLDGWRFSRHVAMWVGFATAGVAEP